MKAQTKWNQLTSIFLSVGLIATLLLLQGCSGGGGGGTPTPPPTDANPTGYYDNNGTAAVDDGMGGTLNITDMQGMISGNRFMMLSILNGLHYDGTITNININGFTADVTIYQDGQNPMTATIAGTITEGSRITGILTGAGAGSGTFTLIYGQFNNLDSAFSRVENVGGNATWDYPVAGPAFDFTQLIINNSGVITPGGATTDGFFQACQINGTITPIANTSLYNVDFTLTACNPNTTANLNYIGLAASSDNMDNRIILGVSDINDTFSVNGDFD